MKTSVIVGFAVGLLCFHVFAAAEDRLGASPEEMERLKELNKSNTVASQSDQELTKLMVGKWTTGRHEYLYQSDGTWRMLPTDISTTNGRWRIQNHQLVQETKLEKGSFSHAAALTFIEASPKQLVLRNEGGLYPFRYVRIE